MVKLQKNLTTIFSSLFLWPRKISKITSVISLGSLATFSLKNTDQILIQKIMMKSNNSSLLFFQWKKYKTQRLILVTNYFSSRNGSKTFHPYATLQLQHICLKLDILQFPVPAFLSFACYGYSQFTLFMERKQGQKWRPSQYHTFLMASQRIYKIPHQQWKNIFINQTCSNLLVLDMDYSQQHHEQNLGDTYPLIQITT